MKCLKQLCIISGISFAGEIIALVLPLPIPGSIYGMMLLFLLLQCGILKLEQIEEGCSLLLAIMPILFVPAGVGLIEQLPLVKEYAIPMLLIIVVTTAIVMLATGKTAEIILKFRKGRNRK